ncbi:MAG: lytic transglycosylase domain-containing protein [Deltaproteobacteria bacterium]|nr:lytic transglycosylase domain-containing protein [Deltaproteobacteria bacterium]
MSNKDSSITLKSYVTILVVVGLIFILPFFSLSEPIIYQIYNADGSVTFTSRKPGINQKYKVFTGSKRFSVIPVSSSKSRHEKFSQEIKRYIEIAAKLFNLEVNLLKAIIKAESNFNPYAVSPKGALGLMQLMPNTAKEVEVKNVFDPKQNILGGARYLRNLLDRFNNNLTLALAAYNAGPEAVEKYDGVPPFPETQKYVRDVLNHFRYFKTLG